MREFATIGTDDDGHVIVRTTVSGEPLDTVVWEDGQVVTLHTPDGRWRVDIAASRPEPMTLDDALHQGLVMRAIPTRIHGAPSPTTRQPCRLEPGHLGFCVAFTPSPTTVLYPNLEHPHEER